MFRVSDVVVEGLDKLKEKNPLENSSSGWVEFRVEEMLGVRVTWVVMFSFFRRKE